MLRVNPGSMQHERIFSGGGEIASCCLDFQLPYVLLCRLLVHRTLTRVRRLPLPLFVPSRYTIIFATMRRLAHELFAMACSICRNYNYFATVYGNLKVDRKKSRNVKTFHSLHRHIGCCNLYGFSCFDDMLTSRIGQAFPYDGDGFSIISTITETYILVCPRI